MAGVGMTTGGVGYMSLPRQPREFPFPASSIRGKIKIGGGWALGGKTQLAAPLTSLPGRQLQPHNKNTIA
jgi:hypothetical protein